MQLNENAEIVAKIAGLLGIIYRSVNWKKISRISYDVFEHRLEVATYNEDVPSFLKKLCNGLSLQAPPIPISLLESLEKENELVLKLIRSWPQYFVYKAAQVSKMIKEDKSKDIYRIKMKNIIKNIKEDLEKK